MNLVKFIIIALLGLSITFASSTPGPDCVIWYKKNNFQGDKVEKCNSIKEVGNNWKNDYSSVKFGSNVDYVIAYGGNNFQGNQAIYTTDMAELGSLNNGIQSFSISTFFSDDCIRLWENEHLTGTPWSVCTSKTTIQTDKQNKFSFVQIGNNVQQAIFLGKPYYNYKYGVSEEIAYDDKIIDKSFGSVVVNHKALSDNCIWLFKGKNYSKTKLEICNWTSNIGFMAGWAYSIKIGKNVGSIQVYSDYDYSGSSNAYSSDQSDLGSWNQRIRSVKVG